MTNYFPLYVVAASFAGLWLILFMLVRLMMTDPLLARETKLYVRDVSIGTVYEEPIHALSNFLLYHGIISIVVQTISWSGVGFCNSNGPQTAAIGLFIGVIGLLAVIISASTIELSGYSFTEFNSESGWLYVSWLTKWDGTALNDCADYRVYHFPSGERDPLCQQFTTVEFCCAVGRSLMHRFPFDWYSRNRFTDLICFAYAIAHLPYLMICWAYAIARTPTSTE